MLSRSHPPATTSPTQLPGRTICFGTHWTCGNTPYGNFTAVLPLLVELGVRHVRDGGYPNAVTLARIPALHAAGISTTYVMVPMDGVGPAADPAWGGSFYISSGSDYNATLITDLLVSQPGIDAVECMNEEDLFYSYGQGTYWHSASDPQKVDNNATGQYYWANYTRAVTCAAYAQIKGNASTAHVRVIGPSMGGSYAYGNLPPLGNLSQCVDWGNVHSYPFGGNSFSVPYTYDTIAKYYWSGDFPTVNIDAFPFALDVYGPTYAPKPLAATETGWWTSNQGDGISLNMHAKYIPRLFMEYYRKGFPRTCSYELIDEFPDAGMQSNFGLIKNDLTPKPAYTALQGLIGLLQDKAGAGQEKAYPASLAWKLTITPYTDYADHPEFVHHIVLGRTNGTLYIPIWHDIANGDTSAQPVREIFPPPMPLNLTLPAPYKVTGVWYPDASAGWTLAYTPVSHTPGTTFPWQAQDYVQVLQVDSQ